jgi:predicted amidophosphoribosyltransferase
MEVLSFIIIVGGIALWLSRTIQGKGGNCPSCGKGIKSNVYVCHHCGRDKRAAA